MNRLLGLYRESEYSPGRHQTNDVLVLEQVADWLRQRRFVVDLKKIEEIASEPPDYALVFSMCQGPASLEILSRWENSGVRIINSPRAARNTYRDRLAPLMINAGIPFPKTQLISTKSTASQSVISEGVWLKRGDVHASVAEDVQRIDSSDQLAKKMASFSARGINVVALQENRPGQEIKFYAVGADFFFWTPARGSRGLEFDESLLRQLAADAGSASGLEIFGGDAIVSENGELTLIDLNDWPSFAPCRDQASSAIADFIAARAGHVPSERFIQSANENAI